MEYYSAIKNNELMPFVATWMDLEIIIRSKVESETERQISYDVVYMWNLKGYKWTYLQKAEINPQAEKTSLWLPKRKVEGEESIKKLGLLMDTFIYKMDHQQGPTI